MDQRCKGKNKKQFLTLNVKLSLNLRNPKIQVYAAENGLLQLILNLMSKNDASNNDDLSAKLIYVLSSLIRHFPFVQIKFIEIGGIKILNDFMKNSSSHKSKVKILTLVDDLVKEKVVFIKPNQ